MRNLTFGGNPISLLGEEIMLESVAPNFTAVKQDLSPFDFYATTGNKIKIISVAPSIDTGVCSLQTIRFNEEAAKLKAHVDIVTITVDLPFAQKRFCAAEGIENIHVISDYQQHNFGLQYGFLIDGLKLLARGVVVVDQNNVVKYVEYVSEGTHHPDYDAAIEATKALI